MLFIYLAMIDDDTQRSKFEYIYHTYYGMMYKVAYELTKDQRLAEDAVHETMVNIIEDIDTIRMDNPKELKSYLYLVTKSKTIDFIRRWEKRKTSSVLGSKIDIMNVWQHISTVFIDALRDVESELRKPKNPIRQIIDTIEGNIEETDIDDIKRKISELNQKISHIPQVSDIGSQVNQKLLEMIGAIYSPEIKLESRLKEDFATLARYLTISPSNQKDIDLLGLGHLNILYIAMKLVEFEVNRNRELLNIMIIEEPEAHIHTHIQKTLFNNLQVTHTYTQVVMSTHSTHLSEVSDIEKVNVMKKVDEQTSLVMKPTNGLDQFGADVLEYKGISFSKILSRYLDAKRSVLLFSKGVIMVEGDGEEILIPALVKKVLGVSLDEMGIGLINIGSVGFENVAYTVIASSMCNRSSSLLLGAPAVTNIYSSPPHSARLARHCPARSVKPVFPPNSVTPGITRSPSMENILLYNWIPPGWASVEVVV